MIELCPGQTEKNTNKSSLLETISHRIWSQFSLFIVLSVTLLLGAAEGGGLVAGKGGVGGCH